MLDLHGYFRSQHPRSGLRSGDFSRFCASLRRRAGEYRSISGAAHQAPHRGKSCRASRNQPRDGPGEVPPAPTQPAPIPGRDILFSSKHTGTDIHRHPSCIKISRQNRFYPSHINTCKNTAADDLHQQAPLRYCCLSGFAPAWCVWPRTGEKRKKLFETFE